MLDKASRAYSEGKPIVMILTGTADRTGERRSQSRRFLNGARRQCWKACRARHPGRAFQVLAKGETELPVPYRPWRPEPKTGVSTSPGGNGAMRIMTKVWVAATIIAALASSANAAELPVPLASRRRKVGVWRRFGLSARWRWTLAPQARLTPSRLLPQCAAR